MATLRVAIFSAAVLLLLTSASWAQEVPVPAEGDYVAHNFHFRSGEELPELKLHYRTLGHPVRDANGHVKNAVLIAHGTTGSGKGFLNPSFAGVSAPANCSIRSAITSFFPTPSATAIRASRATACMPDFRSTTTTTW